MTDEATEQKLERLESRIEELEQELREVKGGEQPDDQLKLWADSGAPTPGCQEIATLIKKIKKSGKGNGLKTHQVEEHLDVGSSRAREIMKEIGKKHPDFTYKPGRGSLSSRILEKSVSK